jgi:hypothetical protein
MVPDRAAELLQLPERGLDLLERIEAEPNILKAIERVQMGFDPKAVAAMFHLPFEAEAEEEPQQEGINVWQCRTPRCKQRERVSTATNRPQCPSCGIDMEFLQNVEDAIEISHMKRTQLVASGLPDPLARTDKTNAPDHALGDL